MNRATVALLSFYIAATAWAVGGLRRFESEILTVDHPATFYRSKAESVRSLTDQAQGVREEFGDVIADGVLESASKIERELIERFVWEQDDDCVVSFFRGARDEPVDEAVRSVFRSISEYDDGLQSQATYSESVIDGIEFSRVDIRPAFGKEESQYSYRIADVGRYRISVVVRSTSDPCNDAVKGLLDGTQFVPGR